MVFVSDIVMFVYWIQLMTVIRQ